MRTTKPETVEGEITSSAIEPFSEVTMDLVQIDEQYMLVVECMFSRFAETVLLPTNKPKQCTRLAVSTSSTGMGFRCSFAQTTAKNSRAWEPQASSWGSSGDVAHPTSPRVKA
jgi:predicted membrane GTPase involved in stress response